MCYNDIDEILFPWARKKEITILEEEMKPNRRYFYISSRTSDTFQVVIEPPHDSNVRIDVHLIETDRDEEIHRIYEDIISNLEVMLDTIHRDIVE